MTLSKCTAVGLPGSCFTDRDLKNYTYSDKRSLYLGVLAKHLADAPGVARVSGRPCRTLAIHPVCQLVDVQSMTVANLPGVLFYTLSSSRLHATVSQ